VERLTASGYPAGQFPIERYSDLEAVFAAADPDFADQVERAFSAGLHHPRAEALVAALGELSMHAQLKHMAAGHEPPSALSKKFHAISAAADTLLAALEVKEGVSRFGLPEQLWDVLNHFAKLGDDQLELDDNISAVLQIRKWANQAEALTNAMKRDADRPTKVLVAEAGADKWPEFDFYEAIFKIWGEILGGRVEAGYNHSTKSASGPLVRFVAACFRLLGLRVPPANTIRDHVRKSCYYINRDPSPE
jgi:hypothetical protein